MNLGRFLHMRMQGASIDAPIANDIGGVTDSLGLGSKQAGTTQTVNAPWGPAQGYLMDIFNRAQGQSFAGQSPNTQQAQQLTANRALAGSPLNTAAQGQALSTINGDYTDLSKNPSAQSAMDSARSKINAQFTGDNYGNSAHQEWLSKGLLSAAAPYYDSERNRQLQAAGMAPSLANQDYTDLGLLGQVGASQDAFPWQQLQNYQGLVSGAAAGTGTQTQPYFTNPIGDLASLGLSSAMIAKLSDRRLKKDIEKVGVHPVGVPLYRFKYLWSDEDHVGVMADELEKIRPDAVRTIGGYKLVNYGAINV